MREKTYEIGETIYYANSEVEIGKVIGVREVYWSHDKASDVTYTVSTKNGRVRNVSGRDVREKI